MLLTIWKTIETALSKIWLKNSMLAMLEFEKLYAAMAMFLKKEITL